jgi:hypothetical protein
MATQAPEATAPDGGLTLADADPDVEHYAPGSDRFVVRFRFKGPDLLQLQNVLTPRLAGIGVGRSTRTGMTISLYGVEHGREGEVLAEVQRAIDEVNQARQAGRENAERERAAVDAAGVLSEAQVDAVRESFRTARCEPISLQVLETPIDLSSSTRSANA